VENLGANCILDEVVTPLGFNGDQTKWVSGLGGLPDGDGSLAGAYGLIISPREYSRIMLALAREGNAFNGSADVPGFLTPARVSEILDDQSEGSRIGFSQFSAFGYQWKYGLGNWRYCSNPNNATECDKRFNISFCRSEWILSLGWIEIVVILESFQ
jgi:CubicO group peptidase (beta-lactamase class C family)